MKTTLRSTDPVASGDPHAVAAQPITFPPMLRQVWILMLGCASLSTLFHLFWALVLHRHGHYRWPFSLNSTDRFADFTIFKMKYAHWHQPDFFSIGFPINYPAPLIDLFEAFFLLPRYPTVAFIVFTTACLIVPCILFARALRSRDIRPGVAAAFSITLFLFSWPGLLLIDGANMEIAVWVVTALGFWGLATGRDNVAAIGFGLAGSFKLFPFVLLAIFLSEKKYGKFMLGIATMAGMTLVSLWILGPTVHEAWAGVAYGIASFKTNYMAQWHSGENGVDHSLFALIKFSMICTHLHGTKDFFKPLTAYLAITSIGGFALYLFKIRLLPAMNQALSLTVASIYLTAFSGDGTLIHLYAPFAMLTFLAIDAWKRKIKVPGLQATMLTLTFILSPVSFFIVKDHRYEGQIKCLALTLLFYLALRYPFGPALQGNTSPDALACPDATLVEGSQPEPA